MVRPLGADFAPIQWNKWTRFVAAGNLFLASSAGSSARGAAARIGPRRRPALRAALHVGVHDETNRFIPRRNRPLDHRLAARRARRVSLSVVGVIDIGGIVVERLFQSDDLILPILWLDIPAVVEFISEDRKSTRL